MLTEKNPDVLERLRRANIASDDDPAPPLAQTLGRIDARRDSALDALRSDAIARLRVRRARLLGGAAAAAAVGIAVVVLGASGPSQDGGSAPLGVLQVAAASAQANVGPAQFSAYVAETVVDLKPTTESKGLIQRSWKIIRPLSDTEFEGRLETLHPAPTPEQERQNRELRKANRGKIIHTDGAHTSRREGDQIREVYTWQRPYGTIFNGGLSSGAEPARIPTDPAAAANAVAALAAGDTPADIDKDYAALLRDAAPFPLGRALNYAEDVLTAPRVRPDVRAAAYQALSRVAGIAVDDHASDPAGRPAAALRAQIDNGATHTRVELLFDPESARVLAERVVFTVDPGANDHRPAGQPPYGEGSQVTTYRYGQS